MTTISSSIARQTLPAQLDAVEAGDEVAITRHGRVVAVLVSPETLRSRRASDAWRRSDRIGDRLAAAREAPVKPAATSARRVEELVDAARAARESR